MGVEIKILKEGNGIDSSENGDEVTTEYKGYLYEKDREDSKGKLIDSTDKRGPFTIRIGVGKVIDGWDEGIVQMTLGEKSTLTISSDDAYGERGCYDLIPPHSDLIFDVELKSINGKEA